MKRRIMFVCHGNICRSPMAEIIFNDMLEKEGMTGFTVASSATSTEEIWGGVGNPIYPPARRELIRRGYTFPEHRATLLLPEDYERYDLFLAMDKRNVANIKRIFDSDREGKVMKLLDLTEGGGDVSDPWYSGDFERAFLDIYHGCECLIEYVKKY